LLRKKESGTAAGPGKPKDPDSEPEKT